MRKWCPGAELNHRHCDFQSHALPTELPGRRAVAHSSCPGADQADSAGGSSSLSSCGAGIRYCPVSQRPRSTSAQRLLQNGDVRSAAGLPQTGHLGHQPSLVSRRLPQGRDPPQNQGATGAPRKVRQRHRVGLQRGNDGGRGDQHRHPTGAPAAPAATRRSAAKPAACGPAATRATADAPVGAGFRPARAR